MYIPISSLEGLEPKEQLRATPRADRLFQESRPRSPLLHLMTAEAGAHMLLADGSRLYRLAADHAAHLQEALFSGESSYVETFLEEAGLVGRPFVEDTPLQSPPLRSLSLAVAQKCNLGCTYCYAQEGDFGMPAQNMSLEVAVRAIDRMLAETPSGERAHLAFLGGEPLVNRATLYAATEYAFEAGQAKGVALGFAITTNGTLLTPEDGAFFERYGFAVTLSLDGVGPVHDRQRAFKNGQGSYDRILERVQPLLRMQRRMQVSARVTVTPENLCLPDTLDALIALGFHSVGFSPMLSSPTGRGEMDAAALAQMLEQMVVCGEAFEHHVLQGKRYPFLNMVTALQELHRGTHRPYPCGAGASYMGVSADGDLFACHRFVNDAAGHMGEVENGVNRTVQNAWLAARHVHRQEPCRSCWARYLCGGGCHHEVIRRGRPACDYIRGWLHYSLQAYLRLSEQRPEYFGSAPQNTDTPQPEALRTPSRTGA
ncbi:MAG: radical domain protein [Chthonomonadales bacterium]|nr:radical domain protein [Chthonomonadales bacterium]